MKVLGLLLLTIFSFPAMSGEKNVYDFSWLDPDKEVYVLQNRKFRKDGKLYVGTTFGRSVSGAFIDSMEGNLYGGYFFKEDWGIELSYTKASGQTNATHDAVNEGGAAVAFYRKLDTVMSAHLVWSPFYSKINTFNKIFYFDWLFGLGFSSYTSLDNRNEFGVTDKDKKTSESGTGVSWFTGMRFYINETWSFRMDFSGLHSNADRAIDSGISYDVQKSWFHYYNFRLGVNYTF
jgi:outer membrane beta-barrel protein